MKFKLEESFNQNCNERLKPKNPAWSADKFMVKRIVIDLIFLNPDYSIRNAARFAC